MNIFIRAVFLDEKLLSGKCFIQKLFLPLLRFLINIARGHCRAGENHTNLSKAAGLKRRCNLLLSDF